PIRQSSQPASSSPPSISSDPRSTVPNRPLLNAWIMEHGSFENKTQNSASRVHVVPREGSHALDSVCDFIHSLAPWDGLVLHTRRVYPYFTGPGGCSSCGSVDYRTAAVVT